MPRRLLTISALLIVAGCSRPEVPVATVAGKAGDLCVTDVDCAAGVTCLERACCPVVGCAAVCAGVAARSNLEGVADLRREHRACVRLCCQGVPEAQIEHRLERLEIFSYH